MDDESELNNKPEELQKFLGKVKRNIIITLSLLFSLLFLLVLCHRFLYSKSYSDCVLKNDAESCYHYASSVANSTFDDQTAHKYYVKACKYGSANGCNMATAELPMVTEIISPNEKYMMQIKACELGKSFNCLEILARQKEKKLSKLLDDPVLYKKVYSSVCPESRSGCTFLSDVISENIVKVREHVTTLSNECKKRRSNSKSCTTASLYYLFGVGVKKDRLKATNMIFSPCSLSGDFNSEYCENLVYGFDSLPVDLKSYPELEHTVSFLLKKLEQECSNVYSYDFEYRCKYKLNKYQNILCVFNNDCNNQLLNQYEEFVKKQKQKEIENNQVQTEVNKKADAQYRKIFAPFIKDIPEDQIENTLSKKCKEGDGIVCGVLAGMYDRGAYVNKNYGKNIEYLKKGCELNELSSCRQLSVKYSVNNKDEDALEIYKHLCDNLDQKEECASVAKLYLLNDKFSDKQEQGKEYLKALCDDKSERSQHHCKDITRAIEHRDRHREMSPSSGTK